MLLKKFIESLGINISEFSRRTGVDHQLTHARISRGWSAEFRNKGKTVAVKGLKGAVYEYDWSEYAKRRAK